MAMKRKRLTAAERRPQIMRAAVRALARSNYRTTSIAEIAAEAGITEPAVYRYFNTKKELFIAILEDVGARVLDLWEQILEQSSSPLEALTRISADYYDRAMTKRGELKVLFQALAEVDDQDIRAALRSQFSGYVALLERIIFQIQEAGLIRGDLDARAAAWSFLSVGFTLNLVALLRLEEELSRDRLGLIQELFVRSLLDEKNAQEILSGPHLGRMMGRTQAPATEEDKKNPAPRGSGDETRKKR